MRRKAVKSTCLRSVGHDPKEDRLEVQFRKSGAVYAYDGVKKRTATALVNASSIGKRFNRSIRDNYEYERLSAGTRKGRKKR